MDPINNDVWNIRGSLKNTMLEYVTPYKICIVILLQEMCLLKANTWRNFHFRQPVFVEDEEAKPIYRRDFCMLALHLIQSPDMEYEEFLAVLNSGKYKLYPELVDHFKKEIHNLLKRDVGSIMDVLNNIDRISLEQNSYDALIKPSSKLGLFLRRVRLFFEKLYFSQTIAMHKALHAYVHATKPTFTSMDMELSSIGDESQIKASHEGPIGLWSKRQLELFLGEQAKLIQTGDALPPPQLQAKIHDVLTGNPDHVEAHFVSYMNCLRSREFCGAQESLYHYFDRRNPQCDEETKCRGLCYAALNLSILHSSFNHKEEAMFALKEAITLAHESNDNVCLQHAQAWMYKLTNEQKGMLIDRSRVKCEDLNLNYLYSFGLQAYAEHAAKNSDLPAKVFGLLSKSDVVNCQHSLLDILCTGHAMRAALWAMYGRSELASLSAQLLLHGQASSANGTEPVVIAVSNIALYFTIQGEYGLAWAVINHGKERAPDSKWWVWSESVLCFTESLHRGLWGLAKEAVDRLAAVDPIEALLRESELCFARGDREGAERAGRAALEKSSDSSVMKVRALYALARALPRSAVLSLTDAYHIATHFYVDYWAALIALEMGNIQLEMGLPQQAVKTVEGALLRVLAHGSWSDISDGLVLYAKCRVATYKNKHTDISEAIRLLSKAATLARHIEAYSKLKKIVYLQALLAHSIGMCAERNKFAYEFRLLDEEYRTDDSPLYAGHGC
ncbi:anaphase-promoting complex subunit 5 [Halyomorpha halys]|uniref:anaphase-promoting complex subunit 5 n=1 Tax=Halyomorpha halys TaxID=286706 RepID=UPI0006D4F4AE